MDITHTTKHSSIVEGRVGLYFGNVDWYRQVACADGDVVYIDGTERYVKQTERNHCRIMAANGVQKLTVPVTIPEGATCTADILVSDHGNWRHQHWEALKSAYGMSPFFEFYQDDIRPFFEKPTDEATAQEWSTLLGFDMAIMRKMFEIIGIRKEVRAITSSDEKQSAFADVLPQSPSAPQKDDAMVGPYYQTFQRRHGFIQGLSILDLLFNEGPETITYLCYNEAK